MIPLIKYIQERPDFESFEKYVTGYEDLATEINKKDNTNSDALYWALDGQLDEVAMWLLENGAEANADAVYAAAQNGNYDAMKILVEKGAPVDEYFAVGGFTPLIAACCEARKFYRDNLQVTKTVNGQKVVVTDQDEIDKIAGKDRYANFPKIVKLLLEKGADPNKVLNAPAKQPALTFAANHGQTVLAKLLLEAGAQHATKDKFGMQAISYAARADYKNETLQLLIEHGAEVNAQEAYGFSPLHEAAENNAVKNIKALLAAGADPSLQLVKAFNPYKVGDTPLDIAKKKKAKGAIELLK